MVEEHVSIYKELGRERKKLQASGRIPDYYTTPGWQMFKEKYQTESEPDVRSTFERIAKTASKHMGESSEEWNTKFFDLMWNGFLAPSTPVMANMGTTRGMPVSCSGSYVGDSVYNFYEAQKEGALLSKNGFGTSSYLGAIRERGTHIKGGGAASGVVPVFKDFVQMSRDVSQGSTRRGSWAGYIPIESGDFWEMCQHVETMPDDVNVGWNISDDFIERLDKGEEDAVARYQKALKIKMLTGKGYFFFVDKVNRQSPAMYKDRGLQVYASNLCMTGDTIITVKGDVSGVKSCTLQHFIENHYNNNLDDWKIWSYDVENKLGNWETITDGAETNPNATIMKITDDETGKSIKCTPDHKIFTKNRGYVMAKELLEDDELVIG